jgi:hypothetical protein
VNLRALEDQQRFYLRRGYLTYRDPLPLDRVFDFSYLQAALRELGRR